MVWWNDPPGESPEDDAQPETPLSEEEANLRESLARAQKLVAQGIPEGERLVEFFQAALDELKSRKDR